MFDDSLFGQAQPGIEGFLASKVPCAFSRPTREVNERRFEKVQGVEDVQSSCKPDDILPFDPIPTWDQGGYSDAKHLKDLPASEHCYESWTEYDLEDPRARHNRVTHEVSNGHDFMSYLVLLFWCFFFLMALLNWSLRGYVSFISRILKQIQGYVQEDRSRSEAASSASPEGEESVEHGNGFSVFEAASSASPEGEESVEHGNGFSVFGSGEVSKCLTAVPIRQKTTLLLLLTRFLSKKSRISSEAEGCTEQ